ncbi:hypothetical protein ACFQVD_04285 [Streptosporangium amethystogenes subsp. fukuiense]|uniref:Uncharacterized protein n=1 Tax=Streptosporangium amethystogenes subsp. fukuiense TaxID=698418 RepID=A0ABW2STL0_9ACTN
MSSTGGSGASEMPIASTDRWMAAVEVAHSSAGVVPCLRAVEIM